MLNRRQFIQLGTATTTGLGLGIPPRMFGTPRAALSRTDPDSDDKTVRLGGDGLSLNPAQYTRLLSRLAEEKGIAADPYSQGGVVEELETQFARILGKERAVFMPTGTLANHMAVRTLADGPSRVIVQEESHLFKDEGDCAQTLSGLALLPLAPGRATFTADDVRNVLDQTISGRVLTRVSVISIETPVRRKQGEHFDPAEMQKITDLAYREGIRLHLDGARLFLQAAYTGQDVADVARMFDTVYISLYKYFNAASGAILAGPKSLLDNMYHGRRMFGGGLYNVWPFAAVALHYLEGFSDRFGRAVRLSEDFIRALGRHQAFSVERITMGTNVFRLRVRTDDPFAFQKKCAEKGVMLYAPQNGVFLLAVNETLNRTTANDLAEIFVRSLEG